MSPFGELPCRKCGKLTRYDGVGILGATTVCKHCGCKKPHTLKGNPLFPYFLLFVGLLVFFLINPFDWDDDTSTFFLIASVFLFVWYKLFWPIHLFAWKSKRSKSKDEEEIKIPRGWGCLSYGLLFFGLLSLLIFCSESEIFSPDKWSSSQVGDYVFYLSGHEVTDGIDSVPLSPVDGNATKIGFVNRAEFPIHVRWLDHNGTLHYFTRLHQNYGDSTEAFVGQTWLVSDNNGTPLLYYIAEEETPDGARGSVNFTWD
ncbi:hypothetical protein OAK38_09430 [Verrucomicrobia bacterium]|nr:hypothetical protein [Verrucomicrobiota bacterium]